MIPVSRGHTGTGKLRPGMADPNQPSTRKIYINRLALVVDKSPQSRKGQMDSSSIVIPTDFTQNSALALSGIRDSQCLNSSHTRS